MAEKSPSDKPRFKWPRYPPTAAGIQVNHCKSPTCRNFGVPPGPAPRRGVRPKNEPPREPGPGDYIVVAAGKGTPCLKCILCGEIFPMHSNLAIAEELLRISEYLEPTVPRCPNLDCADLQPSDGPHCTKYGVNRFGSPRYKCKACKKVFAFGGAPDKGQHRTHHNRDIFRHLVNTVPLRRVMKLLGISASVLYARIDFIHRQCQLFAGDRERSLVDRKDLGKRYISTDRQTLLVNWASKKSRKNTALHSIASADQATGYVYGAHLNFDPGMDEADVARELPKFGDAKLAPPFRRFARVWLDMEYTQAAIRAGLRKRPAPDDLANTGSPTEKLYQEVAQRYKNTVERAAMDDGDEPTLNTRAPAQGMLLHEQYVMQAHIQFVTRLLHRAEKLRFFADQESGLRAALMAACPQRVLDRTADFFYVTVLKEVTVDQKRAYVAQSRRILAKAVAALDEPDADPEILLRKAKLKLMRDQLVRVRTLGKWQDRWALHPLSDMREPTKLICWLTDIESPATDPKEREDQLNHNARLHLKASVTEVDRFFMQVRRALTMAERGVVSASSDRRLWFGKNAYNPGVLIKLLEVFRTYFNYCEVGQDKKTPAMRMGLARGPVAPEDILDFEPAVPAGQRRRVPRKNSTSAAKPTTNKKTPPAVAGGVNNQNLASGLSNSI